MIQPISGPKKAILMGYQDETKVYHSYDSGAAGWIDVFGRL
jgi:hypothetical protein